MKRYVVCYNNTPAVQFPSDSHNESSFTTVTDEETRLPLPTLPDLNHYIEELDVNILADTLAELQWIVPEPIQPLVQGAYARYSASCLRKESGNLFVKQQPSSPVTLRPLGKHDTNTTFFSLYLTVNCWLWSIVTSHPSSPLYSFLPFRLFTLLHYLTIIYLHPSQLPPSNSEPGVPYTCIVTFSHTLNSSRNERQEITFFTRQLGECIPHFAVSQSMYCHVMPIVYCITNSFCVTQCQFW